MDVGKFLLRNGVECEIRGVRAEDLPRISLLESRVWRELAASEAEIRKRFDVFPQGFVGAFRATDALGFCGAVLTDRDPLQERELDEAFPPRHVPRGPYFFLFGLTVDPVLRRLGIGDALVSQEMQIANQLNCMSVSLIANTMSRPLFERHGLTIHSEVDLFHDYPHLMPSPVLMQQKLRS